MSVPLVVYCGVQVGAVGVPVNTMEGLGMPGAPEAGWKQACWPEASDATTAFGLGLQFASLLTWSRTLAQLAPDG